MSTARYTVTWRGNDMDIRYILVQRSDNFGVTVSTGKAKVLSHVLLNGKDIYEVDTHFSLPGGISSSVLSTSLLDKWLNITDSSTVMYTDSVDKFNDELNNCINSLEEQASKLSEMARALTDELLG